MDNEYIRHTPLLPIAIIAALAILGGLVGFLTASAKSSSYSATSTQYFTVEGAKSPDQLVAMNTLLAERSRSYPGLVTSSAVLEPAISELGLDTTASDLASSINAEITPETLLMTITASAESPEEAVKLTNAVSKQAARYIPEVEDFATVGADVNVVEVDKAAAPTAANSPSAPITALVGATLGGLVGYLVLSFLMGRRIRRERAQTAGEEPPYSLQRGL